jgi:rare lipoprotein A
MSRRVKWVNAPLARVVAVFAAALLLANCSGSNVSRVDPRYGVTASPRVVSMGEPVPKGGGSYRIGKPYVVGGRTYYPDDDRHYRTEGIASWYGADFHGRLTANGEVYDLEGISAAHPTMPLPSYARVTNTANGRSLIVRVNDRGPYHGNRVIDVSMKAAHLLGFHRRGTANVRVEYVGPAPLEGSDDRVLAATLRHDQPAPAPVRMASARHLFPEQPPPPTHPFASGRERAGSNRPSDEGSETVANVMPQRAMRPEPAPRRGPLAFRATEEDGTAQILSARGLY